jgi:hypothetical protein
VVALCLAIPPAVAFGQVDGTGPIKTTLCDLRQNAQSYAEKIVEVRGRIAFDELWVEDPSIHAADCPAYMHIMLAFPIDVKPTPDFGLDRDVSFRQFDEARQRHMAVDVTIEGRFDPVFVWRTGQRTKVGDSGGYAGERADEDGRIVVRRISDAVALPFPTPTPQFQDFRVSSPGRERGDKAMIEGPADETTAQFRERVREAAKKGPNFAGHYAIVTWREEQRTRALLVDTRTLEIHDLPFSGVEDCWHHKQDLLLYKFDSGLLIVQGDAIPPPFIIVRGRRLRRPPRLPFCWWSAQACGTYYYRWNGNTWTRLQFVQGVPHLPVEISGSIVDPDGAPGGEVQLILVPFHGSACENSAHPGSWVKTDQDGRFSVTVAADKYDIRIGLSGWHFGATNLVSNVDGEAGGHIELGNIVDWLLLPKPPEVAPFTRQALAPIAEPLASVLRLQVPPPPESGWPIKTTICELLKEAERFSGKMVQVRAKVVSSLEAGGLMDSSCLALTDSTRSAFLLAGDDRFPALSGRTGEYAFLRSFAELKHPTRLSWRPIQLPPPIHIVENDAYHEYEGLVRQKFKSANGNVCVDCPLFEIAVTVVGRFDHLEQQMVAIRANRKERPTPYNAGFGHLNASLNRLVWQSVLDVVASPIDPMVYEKRK